MEPRPHTLTSTADIKKRFWAKVNKTESCWIWTASKNKAGYGFFWPTAERWIGAHRYSYYLANGKFDQMKFVCHSCDNPSCVNPNHLFLGSNSDNIKDASIKGRLYKQFNKSKVCGSGKHELKGSAIRIDSEGKRRCRWCQNEGTMKRYLLDKDRINQLRRERYHANK